MRTWGPDSHMTPALAPIKRDKNLQRALMEMNRVDEHEEIVSKEDVEDYCPTASPTSRTASPTSPPPS